MLAELHIRDFAIISEINISFSPGFNAFTGETGAGKSIIIDALDLVLGGRASPDMVRTGASSSLIQAMFVLEGGVLREVSELLESNGLDPSEELIITREISSSGRSSARINGSLVPVTLLRQLGENLVDITGQSEHLVLLRPSAQRDMLDHYAGAIDLRSEVSQLYNEIRQVQSELDALVSGQREAERRADMLRYQIEEISSADLQPGEDEELLKRRNLLANAEKLAQLADNAYQSLYSSSTSAIDQLQQAQSLLEELVRLDNSLSSNLDMISEAVVAVEEASLSIRRYRDSIEFDPGMLEVVEERLDLINKLKRKYGATIEEILQYRDNAEAELSDIENSDEKIRKLETQLENLRQQLAQKAKDLSSIRSKAAKDLGRKIEQELNDLLMTNAQIEIKVGYKQPSDYSISIDGTEVGIDQTGADDIELLVSPNPGEPLKPIAKVASGGEISRIMLAIRTVLSAADTTPTLVFDEVDVGIGGRSGRIVGEKLTGLASNHQVIAITHLAQVAAYADTHFKITKVIQDNLTTTRVDKLDREGIRHELAAMLGGMPVTDRSLQSADELIDLAKRSRRLSLAS
ncbi:DNA repair protein RecN [Thermobaculum terrenum ATCC BAA-798]|uniref:DNA repair protein RecN n=1 Tax=Thermobaculum terrenum (strain ATCC BAA-798 / CCMEE 7001 / YNP1) TaxID=525904 RepID=D1CCQ7_THET1|nr:DNA repair protein RecN [Thermobaculum terrenum]ACZ42572.1 DNA repair protein RecN [Thermobaculum terrenum ATCC BAA-798]